MPVSEAALLGARPIPVPVPVRLAFHFCIHLGLYKSQTFGYPMFKKISATDYYSDGVVFFLPLCQPALDYNFVPKCRTNIWFDVGWNAIYVYLVCRAAFSEKYLV